MKKFIYLLILCTALLPPLFDGVDNYVFAVIIVVLFLTINIMYFVKYKKNNILCFELFFAISFLLCTFLTVFVTPLMDAWQLRVFILDNDIIRKTYQYGFLGYLFYMLGLLRGKREAISASFEAPQTAYNYSNLLCTFFLVLFFLRGGVRLLNIYTDQNIDLDNRTEGWGEVLAYAIMTYAVSVPLNFKKTGTYKTLSGFLSNLSPLFVINSVILITMLLASGYRSEAFKVLLPLVIAFSIQVRPFKVWETTVLLVGGAIFMLFIGATRSGGDFSLTELSFLDYVTDYTSANAANGFLIDYTDSHGCTYGSNLVVQLFSIIPFMQGIIMSFIPAGVLAPKSSTLFTQSMNVVRGGMGTGLIGDMYYSFSIVGVIVMMYLLGYICRRLENLRSPYIWAMFMNFVGHALFLPRNTAVSILRSIAFGAIIMFIILLFSGGLTRGRNRRNNVQS